MRHILNITTVLLIFIGSWLAVNTVLLLINHVEIANLTGLVSLGILMLAAGLFWAKRSRKNNSE